MSAVDVSRLEPSGQLYNEQSGLGFETIQGPYKFKGEIGAFGLKAEKKKLKCFLKNYLNCTLEGSGIEFELGGSLDDLTSQVLLVFTSFDSLEGVHERGKFRNSSVHFHIPVIGHIPENKLKDVEGEEAHDSCGRRLINGSVQVFSFGSYMLNVITSNEVRGPAMYRAQMYAQGVWMEHLHSGAPARELVDVRMNLPGDGGDGGQLKEQSLIKVLNKPGDSAWTAKPREDTGALTNPIQTILMEFPQLLDIDQKEIPAFLKNNPRIIYLLPGIMGETHSLRTTRESLNGLISGLPQSSDEIAAAWLWDQIGPAREWLRNRFQEILSNVVDEGRSSIGRDGAVEESVSG